MKLSFKQICCPKFVMIFKSPIEYIVTHGSQKGYSCEFFPFRAYSFKKTFDEALCFFYEEIEHCYTEYFLEKDENLTRGAQEIKDWFTENLEYVNFFENRCREKEM